jgi:hypothetical protein
VISCSREVSHRRASVVAELPHTCLLRAAQIRAIGVGRRSAADLNIRGSGVLLAAAQPACPPLPGTRLPPIGPDPPAPARLSSLCLHRSEWAGARWGDRLGGWGRVWRGERFNRFVPLDRFLIGGQTERPLTFRADAAGEIRGLHSIEATAWNTRTDKHRHLRKSKRWRIISDRSLPETFYIPALLSPSSPGLHVTVGRPR